MTEPLPCPFCGHVGLSHNEGSTFRWLSTECNGCGAQCGEERINTMTMERSAAIEQAKVAAIKTWNTRFTPFPPQQQAEPICPECKAAVLYECVACSSNNYPPKQQAEPVAREGFEKWAKFAAPYMDISRFGAGYSDSNTDYAWAGWQAAQRKELSASEILNMMPSAIPAEYDGELMEFARAVETKLKEKNT